MKLSFYFEVSKHINLTSIKYKKVFKCQSDSCDNEEKSYRQYNFCPECGNPVVSKEKEVIIDADFSFAYDFCEEYFGKDDERVYGLQDPKIWLWNLQLPEELRPYSFNLEDYTSNEPFDLQNLDLDKIIESFIKIPEVKELILKFEEIYGKNTITVKYGFVNNFN